MHEREHEVEPPLHATRISADLAVSGLGQSDALQELLGARATIGLGQTLQGTLEQQVLTTIELRVERNILERRAHDAAHLRARGGDIVTADVHDDVT